VLAVLVNQHPDPHRGRLRSIEGSREFAPKAQRRARAKAGLFRKHTPHYYLVLSGISCALVVVALNAAAFSTRSLLLAEVAFAAVTVAALVIFTAFFWGFYMLMNGNIPVHRLKYLLPHACVGVLAPLFYTLNICVALEGLGHSPVSGLALGTSVLCLALLCLQFSMGKAVVHRTPLRLLVSRPAKSFPLDTGRSKE
jgi:hypothetical protein